MSHCAKMLRPAHAAVLMFVSINLVPSLAHARAFGGRFMGFVLFAPVVVALILAVIAALAGKEPGPVTRALQAGLVGCASTCVALSVCLFEVSPLWYALAMAAIFALAKRRFANDGDASMVIRLQHALDLPLLGAAYAPGILVLLLWG